MIYRICVFVVTACLVVSCTKPDDQASLTSGPRTLVTNEGSFLNNNASVSVISSTGTVDSDPYFDRNGLPIGDVLQSLLIHSGYGYAVLNNSQKVEIFRMSDFLHVAEIAGLDYPRYMIALSGGKAYLTNGAFAGEVRILDLNTHASVGSIAVGMGPEKMVEYSGRVFVANSGGWAEDHTVSVIDTATDLVVGTIEVGDRPVDLVVDGNGHIWVLSAGRTLYDSDWNIIGHTPAMFHVIDPVTLDIMWSSEIGEEGDHPDDLAVSPDGSTIYLNLGGVRAIDVTGMSLPGSMRIPGSFNSLDVHPLNGEIWVTSLPDFVSNSEVYRYSESGNLIDNYSAGIAANGVYWR